MIIPLAFIICFFGGPFLLVAYCAHLWSQAKIERYKTVREYLSRGLPVPPELLRGRPVPGPVPSAPNPASSYYSPPVRARRDLRRGIIRTFAGMGICLAFYFMWPHSRIWVWGLIPWIIGVGYIIAYFLEPEEPELPPVPSAHPPENQGTSPTPPTFPQV